MHGDATNIIVYSSLAWHWCLFGLIRYFAQHACVGSCWNITQPTHDKSQVMMILGNEMVAYQNYPKLICVCCIIVLSHVLSMVGGSSVRAKSVSVVGRLYTQNDHVIRLLFWILSLFPHALTFSFGLFGPSLSTASTSSNHCIIYITFMCELVQRRVHTWHDRGNERCCPAPPHPSEIVRRSPHRMPGITTFFVWAAPSPPVARFSGSVPCNCSTVQQRRGQRGEGLSRPKLEKKTLKSLAGWWFCSPFSFLHFFWDIGTDKYIFSA